MAKTSYFAMSEEERAVMNREKLELRRIKLERCAYELLKSRTKTEDEEAELLADIVAAALDAYMRLSKVNRPEMEYSTMTHLAFQRLKIRRQIREELEGE